LLEKNKSTKSNASGGKVCHLESRLPQGFAPRFSGQIPAVFWQPIVSLFISTNLTFEHFHIGLTKITMGCCQQVATPWDLVFFTRSTL